MIPLSVRIALRRAPAVVAWSARSLVSSPERARFDATVCARTTPLQRSAQWHTPAMQHGKEANVARAVAMLDGLVLAPGGAFSWHRHIGPPLRIRGFVPGPELRNGALAAGIGGGVCQVANLLYWLALSGGLEVIERHRHGFDLFPDAARDVPFGVGATVFYPHRDLRFKNVHAAPIALALRIEDGHLHGALTSAEALPHTYKLQERDHQIVGRTRSNVIIRETLRDDVLVASEIVARNTAQILYERSAACSSSY